VEFKGNKSPIEFYLYLPYFAPFLQKTMISLFCSFFAENDENQKIEGNKKKYPTQRGIPLVIKIEINKNNPTTHIRNPPRISKIEIKLSLCFTHTSKQYNYAKCLKASLRLTQTKKANPTKHTSLQKGNILVQFPRKGINLYCLPMRNKC
jgi:hypothetical protein